MGDERQHRDGQGQLVPPEHGPQQPDLVLDLGQRTLHPADQRLPRPGPPPPLAKLVDRHESGDPHQSGQHQVPRPRQAEPDPHADPHRHQQQADADLSDVPPEDGGRERLVAAAELHSETAQHLGHLAVAQAVQVEQDECGVGRRQPVDRGVEAVHEVRRRGDHLWGRQVLDVGQGAVPGPPAAFRAVPAEGGVQGHPVTPGGGAGLAPKQRQRPPHLKQDFLLQVLAIRRRGRVRAGHLQDGTAVLGEPGAEQSVGVVSHGSPRQKS